MLPRPGGLLLHLFPGAGLDNAGVGAGNQFRLDSLVPAVSRTECGIGVCSPHDVLSGSLVHQQFVQKAQSMKFQNVVLDVEYHRNRASLPGRKWCIIWYHREGNDMEQTYLPGTVRDRIQDQLKEQKITQGELAAEIGISESALSRFLSAKTDKIGDDYIVKIADFLGVSTDFILGQTDFPERRNYDIGELGLSYRAAMALYTREVDTDVVYRILENPKFPEITRMIARYFKDMIAEPLAGQNAMMEMLCDIKAGIQTHTPTTELATKQITQAMIANMTKGGSAQPLMLQISLAQLAEGYSTYTGASLELGEQFSDLVKNFITDFIDIAQKQGLTDENSDKRAALRIGASWGCGGGGNHHREKPPLRPTACQKARLQSYPVGAICLPGN